ncbi:uncharacterized protein [Amphiura filiformis]|uniref:uncharacterized protein n=1 Tax=Amphiura filiformis TaxID=82378 RepID=UPI003B20F885
MDDVIQEDKRILTRQHRKQRVTARLLRPLRCQYCARQFYSSILAFNKHVRNHERRYHMHWKKKKSSADCVLQNDFSEIDIEKSNAIADSAKKERVFVYLVYAPQSICLCNKENRKSVQTTGGNQTSIQVPCDCEVVYQRRVYNSIGQMHKNFTKGFKSYTCNGCNKLVVVHNQSSSRDDINKEHENHQMLGSCLDRRSCGSAENQMKQNRLDSEENNIGTAQEKRHGCKKCGDVFFKEKDLDTHCQACFGFTKSGRTCRCLKCGEEFQSTCDVCAHISATHDGYNHQIASTDVTRYQADNVLTTGVFDTSFSNILLGGSLMQTESFKSNVLQHDAEKTDKSHKVDSLEYEKSSLESSQQAQSVQNVDVLLNRNLESNNVKEKGRREVVYREKDRIGKVWTCTLCSTILETKRELKLHMKRHKSAQDKSSIKSKSVSSEQSSHDVSSEQSSHDVSSEQSSHDVSSEQSSHDVSSEQSSHDVSNEQSSHNVSTSSERTSRDVSSEQSSYDVSSEQSLCDNFACQACDEKFVSAKLLKQHKCTSVEITTKISTQVQRGESEGLSGCLSSVNNKKPAGTFGSAKSCNKLTLVSDNLTTTCSSETKRRQSTCQMASAPCDRNRKFSCNRCQQVFRSLRQIKLHLKACKVKNRIGDSTMVSHPSQPNHGTTDDVVAMTAEETGESEDEMRQDKEDSASEKSQRISKYECKKCDRVCLTIGELRQHRKVHKLRQDRLQCDECEKLFVTLEALTEHVDAHKFPCRFCGIEISTPDNRKRHELNICPKAKTADVRKLHEEKKRIVCKECDFSCENRAELKLHMKSHKYKCKYCNMEFTQEYTRNRHEMNKCGAKISESVLLDRKLECQICGQMFENRIHWQQHTKTHKNERWVCKPCNQNFRVRAEFLAHKKTHKGIWCKTCNISFQTTHELDKHKKDHKFPCQFCGQEFSTIRSCRHHIETSCKNALMVKKLKPRKTRKDTGVHKNTEKYECYCDQCGKKFNNLRERNKHRGVHFKQKLTTPTKCPECDEIFEYGTQLRMHQKRVHWPQKPFACLYCKLRFKSKPELLQHEIVHTVDKPHECPICSRRFKSKKYIQHHMYMHTGARPYQCRYCPKFFRQPTMLRLHERRHRGEKPYKCIYCQRCYTYGP